MRRTVDLKPALDVRVVALAKANRVSISAMLADLVIAGLSTRATPPRLRRQPKSGVLIISTGQPLSIAEAKKLAGEEA